MKNILGIVFSNMHEHMIKELTANRCMGSIPVGGRYRLIDFVLSGFANSGIQDVAVIAKTNYRSLLDHLGTGREWDLSRKSGGLAIMPPFAHTESSGTYRGRIEALFGIMGVIKSSQASHVIASDCDMLFNAVYDDMMLSHTQSGADITVMYAKMPVAEGTAKDTCILSLEGNGRVLDVLIDPELSGTQNMYLNVVLISKSLLEYLVGDCYSRNQYSFERDVLQAGTRKYHINAYEYKGYVCRVSSLQNYYDANLALLDSEVRGMLFPTEMPVYTKVRDEAPVRYGLGSKVSNSLLADGCVVEGEVENSVLFRGVSVGRGVKIKNSIIMQGSTIGDHSALECVVADKNVVIRPGRTLTGVNTYPIYIAKGTMV